MRNNRFSDKPVKRTALVTATCLTLLGSGVALAAETSASEVKTELAEAMETIQSYAADQRDDALQSARNAMVRLDARIDRMEIRAESRWEDMSEAAREQMNDTLRALRKQRNEVAEWYGAMKHGSKEAWDDVKRGFSRAYAALQEAVEDARKAF